MIIRSESYSGITFTLDTKEMRFKGRITEQSMQEMFNKVRENFNSEVSRGVRAIFKPHWGCEGLGKRKLKGNNILAYAKELGFSFVDAMSILGASTGRYDRDTKTLESILEYSKKIECYDKQAVIAYQKVLGGTGINPKKLFMFMLDFKKYRDYFKEPETLTLLYYANQYNLIDVLMDCFTSFSHFKSLAKSYVQNEKLKYHELEKAINIIKYHYFLYDVYPTKLPKNLISNERMLQKRYELKSSQEKAEQYKVAVQRFKENFKTVDDEIYYIDFLESVEELSKEGSEMNHCVFSYLNKVVQWRCNIFSIREKSSNKRCGTIEVQGNSIVQRKSKNNFSLSRQTMTYLKKVAVENKLTIY